MIQREKDRSSVFRDLASTLSEQRGGFPGELEALQGGWSNSWGQTGLRISQRQGTTRRQEAGAAPGLRAAAPREPRCKDVGSQELAPNRRRQVISNAGHLPPRNHRHV